MKNVFERSNEEIFGMFNLIRYVDCLSSGCFDIPSEIYESPDVDVLVDLKSAGFDDVKSLGKIGEDVYRVVVHRKDLSPKRVLETPELPLDYKLHRGRNA
jgi:hypothetical protein